MLSSLNFVPVYSPFSLPISFLLRFCKLLNMPFKSTMTFVKLLISKSDIGIRF
jgi:hypothetical protein